VELIHARLAYKTLAVTCQTFSDRNVFVTRSTRAEMLVIEEPEASTTRLSGGLELESTTRAAPPSESTSVCGHRLMSAASIDSPVLMSMPRSVVVTRLIRYDLRTAE